jgi:hypothetical protein
VEEGAGRPTHDARLKERLRYSSNSRPELLKDGRQAHRMATVFDPIRPVPPITTIFMLDPFVLDKSRLIPITGKELLAAVVKSTPT